MAKASRPEDETEPPRRAKRRRRSPVLELQAKEVAEGGEEPAAGDRSERSASKDERTKTAGEQVGTAWDVLRARAMAGDWRALLPAPIVTGALGVLAGALVVFLLMPRAATPIDPRVGELAGEVATLSSRIESLAARPAPAAPDTSGLYQRLDRLVAAVSEAEQRLAAVEKRPEPKAADLSSVNERAAAIEGTLKELRAGLSEMKQIAQQAPEKASSQAVDRLAGQIGGLEARIAALTAARAAPAPDPANAKLAQEIVALHALGDAIRSGAPFANQLEAVRTQAGERAAQLAPLQSYAAKGLPTADALKQRFSALVPHLLRGPEPNGNFFERLVTNASRLIEVRPVGEPAGTSVGAIVARTETKLARGDLTGAVAEVEALPEPARAVAADWLAAARQRRDADALVRSLVDASLARAREAGKP